MKLRGCLFIWALLLMMALPGRGEASATPTIRVALSQGAAFANFQVVSGDYQLTAGTTGSLLASPKPGESWKVTAIGTEIQIQGPSQEKSLSGPLLLQETGSGLNLFSYNGVNYRGNLVVQNQNGKLLLVNLLDIEKYLYGVVGREMGGGAAPEAYCAQAVVSRSYALALKGLNPWYDVGRDTGTQVYGGYSGEIAYCVNGNNPVVEAVEATRGKVLVYGSKVVPAYFHSNAGGYTEDAENVWLEPKPYLKGVPSPTDKYAETNGSWGAASYRWVKTWTREELEEKLGVGRIKTIKASRWRTEVTINPITGKFTREFIPGQQTVSGRVTAVSVVGDTGEKNYYRDSIRGPFSLKSTLFDMILEGQLQVLTLKKEVQPVAVSEACALGSEGNLSKSDGFYVLGAGGEKELCDTSFESVTFSGKGYGHGIGLSQWGARGLAVKGHNWQQILEHYYNYNNDSIFKIATNYNS